MDRDHDRAVLGSAADVVEFAAWAGLYLPGVPLLEAFKEARRRSRRSRSVLPS